MKLNPIGSNMNEIEVAGNTILFSYKTPVAYQDKSGKFFKTNKRWSNTTSKHINKWLDGNPAQEINQDDLDNLVK